MHAPAWRLLCIAAAGTAGLLLPIGSGAAQAPTAGALRAEASSLEHQKRAALLSLYSLDSRLTAARDRLTALHRSEATLRRERARLATALRVAQAGERLSQRALADRVRTLYDHGGTSTLEVIFGAGSLSEAMNELDNLDRLTSLDNELVIQAHAARLHELQTKAQLTARQSRLATAIQRARSEAQTLADVREARTAYIQRLASRQALDLQQIARLDAQARAAEARAQQLTKAPPAATSGTPVPIRTTQASGNVISVVATGYCLTGRTATGLPVGWGVAAVDPRVIALGTHLTIPGYGEAVAADTGGSIVGGHVDLWFPTCAQAGGWGTRSVTIALH